MHSKCIKNNNAEEMMIKRTELRKNMYFDSVTLMSLTGKIREMEGVEDAEVTALKQTNGDDTLIAFLTGQVMERKQLVKNLSCHLKPWEIPSRFMVLPAIPRTSTGKADRKKLEELAGKPEG